jgi:hypothetical protein
MCTASPNHIIHKPRIQFKVYDLLLIDAVQSSRVWLQPICCWDARASPSSIIQLAHLLFSGVYPHNT